MPIPAVTQLNANLDAFLEFLIGALNQGAGDPEFANALPGDPRFEEGGVNYWIQNTIWPSLVASCSANGDPAPDAMPPLAD